MRTLPILNKAYMLILAMSLTFTSCNLESLLDGILGEEDDEEEGDYGNSSSTEPAYEIIDFSDFEDEPYAEYAAKYEIEGIDHIGSVELLADGSFVIMPPESEVTKAGLQSLESAGTRSSVGYMDGSWIYAYGRYYYQPADGLYYLEDVGTMNPRNGSVVFDFSGWTLMEKPYFSKVEGKYKVEQHITKSSFTNALCRRWVLVAYHDRFVGYSDYENNYNAMVYDYGFESYVTFSQAGTYLSGCFDEYGWDVPDRGRWEVVKSGDDDILRHYYYEDGELFSYESKIEFVKYAGKPGRYMRFIGLRKGYLGDSPMDLTALKFYYVLKEQPVPGY